MNDPFEAMFAGLRQPRIPGVPYDNQPKPKAPPRERKRSSRRKVKLDHPGERPRRWDDSPKVHMVGDREVEFFPVGALAMALGRQVVTIRSWEAKGWLPEAVFRSPAPAGGVPGRETVGRRLYSRYQVELVLRVAAETGVLSLSNRGNTAGAAAWAAFAKKVTAEWRAEL